MLRKLSIIFIRLAPVLLAIKILVLLLAEYFVVSSLLIGLVSSITDLLIAIGQFNYWSFNCNWITYTLTNI